MSSTLADLVEVLKRRAPEYLDLMTAPDEEKFEAAFGAILERVVCRLEANSRNFESLDEVGLTAVLCAGLEIPGLTVVQEGHSNGHVDLTVTIDHCSPVRRKLAEAKIHAGPAYHLQGLDQLLGRYTTGRECRGLLISYVKGPGIDRKVEAVRKRMDDDLPVRQQGKTEPLAWRWTFLSRHRVRSGRVLDVAHVSCNLDSSTAESTGKP